jgi:nucleotidyltransferase substrate binding protein (TIGR01987 family)
MERLDKRKNAVADCLKTLAHVLELASLPKYQDIEDELRDSIIQRFEYSWDTFWKYLREYLELKEGLHFEVISPKSILRGALEVDLIKEEDFTLFNALLKDRNLTSHTYNKELAVAIANQVPAYYKGMLKVFNKASSL